jgi:hypothetical protein
VILDTLVECGWAVLELVCGILELFSWSGPDTNDRHKRR